MREITTLTELRGIIGEPRQINRQKTIHQLDDMARAFIAHSPFCLIASYNREHGYLDISPKGDAPGFVLVRDDTTLIVPERPGNKLAVTFSNLLTNPLVSLIFIIPGKKETLRLRGSARVIVDDELASRCAVNNKTPVLLLKIEIRDLYFHCAKCMLRSKLWQPESWLNTDHLPNLGRVLACYSQQEHLYETINEAVKNNYVNNLY